jgi:hypothetical protein
MAIPSKRFEFLDKETNVSVSSFSSKLDSGILNAVQEAENLASATLESLIESATQIPLVEDAKGLLDEATRAVKGAQAALTDLSNLGTNTIDDFIGDLTENSGIAGKAIKNIISKCGSGKGFGVGLPGRPYDVSMKCNGRDISLGSGSSYGGANCSASSYSDLLNKITNGNYKSSYNDINKKLRKLMGLSGYGIDIGVCGVFSALSEGLPKDALSKAAGTLLEYAGANSKINGFLDIAKSSVGLTPLLHAPSAISTVINNFKAPSDTRESHYAELGERFLGGLELLDSKWAKSQEDGMTSIAAVSTSSRDLRQVLNSKLTDRAFGEDGIDVPAFDEQTFIMAAYVAQTSA